MLNVALCSYGMSSKVFHAPLITAEPRLKLHSILQRQQPTALADYPQVTVAQSFAEIIENPDIHLVVVNTPNEFHFPMAKAALLAGKHVVVEKPFTLSLAEGEALIALAEQQQRILSVFQNKRLESDHLDVQQVIQSGQLGRIVEVEWHYDRYRTSITHKKWKEDNLPGSGTWFDLGIHMVDSMLCLFGKPEAVYAEMRSLRRAEGSTDYFTSIFHYQDMRVMLRSNTYVSEKGATVSVHGDRGSFLKFGQDVQEAQMMRGITPGMPGWAQPGEDNYGILHCHHQGESQRHRLPGQPGCYEHYYQNIVDAIVGTAPLAFLPQQSLLGVELLLAGEESARQHRLVSL
ncbi:Gfo/Idh/MocA family oxidoreductase [Cellvibrio japonicus]|uniref:Oxidoreductase n=1 Tax=Cellvibrio japonicus (strain Ueda107) TaxID=498211 RepID=B3PCF7_CELJU|nr:Gfo/Idh/MocA family oxidoreductase [Cellvibrio japonicus]ACE85815.1 oxidoreductase [Cellvibrio japonicus Ueda107]QEI11862.1 oxidoreductase [Cellvibrio japonicus]QEI15436.1 oxidoreductase [Cellvibrio japonicus]QEI19015.1 oxidoreductase [Cellvibrio japonicus]